MAVEQRQPVGRVIGERVAALLRLQQQREGGIALDVDPLDRIHLHRDFQAHGDLLGMLFATFLANWKPKENRPLTFYRHYSRLTTQISTGGGRW